jgi:hypothetical protein
MRKGVPFTDLTTMTRDIPPAVDRAWADLKKIPVVVTTRGAL